MRAIASSTWITLVVAGAMLAGCPSSSGTDAGHDVITTSDVQGTDVRDTGAQGDVRVDATGDHVVPPSDGGDVTQGNTDGGTTDADVVTLRDVVGDTAQGLDGQSGGDAGSCGSGVGACNPLTSTGCQPNEGCYVAGDGDGGVTTFCNVAPNTGGFGDPCASPEQCIAGFACLGNECRKLCCVVGDDTPCRTGPGGRPNGVCDIDLSEIGIAACELATACDWFAQDCPDGVSNCLPISADGTTQCVASGTATVGQQCGGSTSIDCVKGAICVQDPSNANQGICAQICDPRLPPNADGGAIPDGGVSRVCPAGMRCSGFGPSFPTNFGACGT